MSHKEIVDKVAQWLESKYRGCTIMKETNYKIKVGNYRSKKPIFRVDIIVKDKNFNPIVGVECKTINDSNNFRKLAAGIGQAYVFQRTFGRAYLAIEVDSSISISRNRFEFYKREALLENAHIELGFGVLLVGNKVVCIRPPKCTEPIAKTLFT